MKSPAAIEKIADPRQRLAAAAAYVRENNAKADEARAERDMAICVARLDDGLPPVAIYSAVGISRVLFNRILQRAPAERPAMEDALARAVAAHKRSMKVTPQVHRVRKVRDDTALGLMGGTFGSAVSNADVARVSGLTTARVAQMRTGVR